MSRVLGFRLQSLGLELKEVEGFGGLRVFVEGFCGLDRGFWDLMGGYMSCDVFT